ncbi:tetratricopeptide repeat protein [Paraburkholderia sartisoli]|uniref:protein O-GlcNAc transferase n=1 Tax=Paraburkholderia sartisoli TaxID=83784 RepID=A0A1H4G1M1_9BURK|nr:tetratricopeptide repeat protein [Paraburkholderia sartisoli]SEB03465.1 Predicted O-linked N-acetylglucosamine transferase, SPINDLY family [Paraburkholderia sartisoli]
MMQIEPTTQSNASLIAAALAHHQAGQLAEARVLYAQILQSEPGNPDALHFLGLLACQLDQHDAGLALIEQSIAAHPSAIYYNNFGNMLREKGRLAEAIDGYRHAVALSPGYAEAWNNLGNAQREAKQPDAAMRSCAQAIALYPGYAEAYNNLGNALHDMGDLDAAVASYNRAIEFRSDYAEAHNNLGNVLRVLDKADAAIASFRTAIALKPELRTAHQSLGLMLRMRGETTEAIASLRRALDPTDANAHNSIGTALCDINDLDAALKHFDTAIALKPDFAEAHCNRGGVMRRLNRFEESVESCVRAIELAPTFAEAYNVLGIAYLGLKNFDAAILSHQYAIELDPDNAAAHNNLACVFMACERPAEALVSCRRAVALAENDARMHLALADVLRALGDHGEGIAAYRRALELNPGLEAACQCVIFTTAGSVYCDVTMLVADARQYGRLVAARARPYRHRAAPEQVTGPLRVGFVSGDFRAHSVSAFLESVVAQLDPARVELFAYSTQPVEDAMTAHIKQYFASWCDTTGMSDEAAASRIHADGVHILVDLSGHTLYNRLPVFAWKPAPVQVTWLGFFATTGIDAIDYVLGDRHVLPVEEEAHFIEKPWRLLDSYLCFTPPQPEIIIGPLPMVANGVVTFGCLNNIGKIGDDVVALWSRVLHAVPDSRLLLKAPQLDQTVLRTGIADRFLRHGIAAERLILIGRTTRDAHLDAFNQVDIALDPFPYPGGTTSVEGLWMGVPVLTRRGDRFLSHVGESIVNTAGLPAWVAVDDDDYVAKAAAFAADRTGLGALRAGLRQQVLASPLCDAPRFARNLEDAFEAMWDAYASGTSAR